MRRLSKEEVNDRLVDRGIIMSGEYIDLTTKTEFRCLKEHVWVTSPAGVINGRGCQRCSAMNRASLRKLTKEKVNRRLLSDGRGLVMTGEYVNNRTKTSFRCHEGHIWETTPHSVMNISGCPHCAGLVRLSKDEVNERLENRGIVMLGDYSNSKINTEFVCSEGHVWVATSDNVLRGTGCPQCAKSGFDPIKPAWDYVFAREGYLKFGITNDLVRRLDEHRKHGEIVLIHEQYHGVGQLALDCERDIKNIFGGKFVTKEQCPDGYTETLCKSRKNELLEFLCMRYSR